MNELLEQKARRELEGLLRQVPESEREMVRAAAAAGAKRLSDYLDDQRWLIGIIDDANAPIPSLIQVVRKESNGKFYGKRFQRVLAKAADLLEEGIWLQTALILAWVSVEVESYRKPAEKAKRQPRIAN